MASLGGAAIFGPAFEMVTVDNPRSEQINAFMGVSGVERLDGGLRGRYTEVRGVLAGDNLAVLNAAVNLFRSFNDGNAYVLFDFFGNGWPYVILETFNPVPKVMTDFYGRCFCRYTARMKHLV